NSSPVIGSLGQQTNAGLRLGRDLGNLPVPKKLAIDRFFVGGALSPGDAEYDVDRRREIGVSAVFHGNVASEHGLGQLEDLLLQSPIKYGLVAAAQSPYELDALGLGQLQNRLVDRFGFVAH